MDGKATGEMALKYPGIIVGVKSAHFNGPQWLPYDQAEIAGTMAHIPVMVDYGARRIERPLYELLETKFRPGDIYTHMYMGGRGEQDSVTGGPGKGMWEGRQRGVYFDVGHGGASFSFSVAVPLIKAGFIPDSISTDIHSDNVNAGMKDELTTADKFLALGLPLKEVVAEMTWNPAREVQQYQLGNFSVGSVADVAVLRVDHGTFGYADGGGARMMGTQKLDCEMTVKDGRFVYDENARSSTDWDKPSDPAAKYASRWTTLRTPGVQRTNIATATNNNGPARPGRWSPYDTDASGKATLKDNAKYTPGQMAKPVAPPVSSWPTPPAQSWPAKQGQ
jgi:dihydroorotase